MNEFELPDDIKQLEKLYRTPEEEIERLEQIVAHQGKTILRQANTINDLQNKLADKPNNY